MTNLSIAKLSLAALAFAALAPAQDTKETPKASPASKPGCCVQQVYQVKNANAAALYQLLNTSPGQGQTPILRHNASMNLISVYGTVSEVTSIIANLKALDMPSAKREATVPTTPSIELTTWILAASTEETGPALPAALAEPVSALGKTFGFKSYTLLSADVIRASEGQGFMTTGNAPAPQAKLASRASAAYGIQGNEISVEGPDTNRSVRVRGFSFSMRSPFCTDPECRGTTTSDVRINSTFRIRERQQVVVGQSKLDGAEKSLILIVSAKVVD